MDQFIDAYDDKFIVFRDKSEANIAQFSDRLSNVNWHDLNGFNDPKNAYACFLDKYRDIYNTCFPLKRAKAKKNTIKKPWLSKGLLKSIRRKNKLYKQYLNTPSYVNEVSYKNYKNKLNHSLRNAKRIYYEKQIEYAKSNAKNTWKILNEVINRKKRTTKLPSTIFTDNHEISNPVEIANRFCDYFTNIGPNLAKKIPASTLSFRSFLSRNFPNSIFLEPVTQQEILDIVNSL